MSNKDKYNRPIHQYLISIQSNLSHQGCVLRKKGKPVLNSMIDLIVYRSFIVVDDIEGLIIKSCT